MKRVVTFVLALAMVLASVSALAEMSESQYKKTVIYVQQINAGETKVSDDSKYFGLLKQIADYEAAHPSITPSGLVRTTVKDTEKEETTATAAATATTTTAAATGAKQVKNPFTSKVIEDSEQTKELLAAFQDALKAGNVLAVFPEGVQKEIPEGYGTINEVITILLSGDVEGITYTTIGFTFQTQYKAGETVILAFGISPTQWILKEGTVQNDGSVTVRLDRETIDRLLDKAITLVVISK